MNDLVSLFKNFIYRDLAFILGGSIVLLAILYAFRTSFDSLPGQPYFLLLFTVLAYVVGYAVQDFGAVLLPWLIFTGYVLQPHSFWQRPYRRFTGSASWRPLTFASTPDEALQFAMHMDRLKVPEATLRDLDRILSLKVISMCVGGCLILSAIIFFIGTVCNGFASMDWILFALFLAFVLAFGVALICLGWVKALQQMQFYEAVKAEEYPLRKGQKRTATNNAH